MRNVHKILVQKPAFTMESDAKEIKPQVASTTAGGVDPGNFSWENSVSQRPHCPQQQRQPSGRRDVTGWRNGNCNELGGQETPGELLCNANEQNEANSTDRRQFQSQGHGVCNKAATSRYAQLSTTDLFYCSKLQTCASVCKQKDAE
jgi:hypothetical protein